jgi:O-antigen ligase
MFGLSGQMVGLIFEILLILLLAGFILSKNQKSRKFFFYIGFLIGGEIFFRNFVHSNIPGYMIVEYAIIGIGVLNIPKAIAVMRQKTNTPLLLWSLFCLYAAVTLLYSPDPYMGRWFLSIFLSGLVILNLSASMGNTDHGIEIGKGTALGVCLNFGLLLNYEVFHPVAERFGHGINSSVQNAIFLTIGVIFFVIITKKLKLKWYKYLVPIMILTLGSAFTFSRGPLLGTLVAVFAILLSENKFSTKVQNFFTFIIVIGIICAIVFNVAPDQFTARFIGISLDTERVGIWEGALAAWKDAPILGWGVGSWSTVYPRYSWINPAAPLNVSDAHNIFLQILVETGIIGIVIFVIFLLSILSRIIRAKSFEQLGLFGYLLAVGFVDNWKILIFFTLLGYILMNEKKNSPRNN